MFRASLTISDSGFAADSGGGNVTQLSLEELYDGFGFWLLTSAVASWLLPSEFHKAVIVISRLDL